MLIRYTSEKTIQITQHIQDIITDVYGKLEIQ